MKTEVRHGNLNGTAATLVLDDDEFIAGVGGYSSIYIDTLIFVTNKRIQRFLHYSTFASEELIPKIRQMGAPRCIG